MAPLPFPRVEKIVSRITPISFRKTFPRSFLSTKTYYIRALNLNEQIALFFPPSSWPNGCPTQDETCLLFEIYWLWPFFTFSRFVHSIFKFYKVTPWMLITNLILFMSAFEEICRGWGFTPSLNLFRAFFKILKDNNRFLNFCYRNGLTIFSSHKDSIKHWVKSFAI